MPAEPLDVLFEDNHLLVVNKPVLLATMGAASNEPSLVAYAKQYLREAYDKPGNVYLGVVSRLDAHVTGAIVLARTSKAAARLTRQFQQRQVHKTYWAVVAGEAITGENRAREGTWNDWVRKDDDARRMVKCNEGDREARLATTRFRWLASSGNQHWLQLHPQTGRKHQLRVQLAARGLAIVGDRKYGSRVPHELGIALHSRHLEFRHPVRQMLVRISAPLPKTWRRFQGWIDESM